MPDTRDRLVEPASGDPETGRIYAQGVCGYFCCLEGDTGKVVWDRSLHEEFGLISTYGGRTNMPVMFEDTVLISAVVVGWGDEPKWGGLARPGPPLHGVRQGDRRAALAERHRHQPVRHDLQHADRDAASAASRRIVFGSGDGEVWALQPRTGKHALALSACRGPASTSSPLVTPDGRVFVSHSEENTFGNYAWARSWRSTARSAAI